MIRFIIIVALLIKMMAGSLVMAEEIPSPSATEANEKLALIEIYSLSSQLPRELIDLQNNLEGMTSVASLEVQLPNFIEIVKDLAWEVNIAESTPEISYHDLALLDSRLGKVKVLIDHLDEEVQKNVNHLQGWSVEWLQREENFTKHNLSLKDRATSEEVADTLHSVEKLLVEAKKLLKGQLIPNLRVGKQVGKIQTQVYTLNATVTDLIRDTNELRIQQTSPSMLSKKFYQRLNTRIFMQAWENGRLFVFYQLDYIEENVNWVVGFLLVIAFLTFCIHLSKKLVIASSRWFVYASRPFSTAVFVVCLIFSIIISMSAHVRLPPDWETLIQLPMILAVAYLADQVTDVYWQNMFLRRLILFLAMTLLLTVINVPHSVFYLFVFYSVLIVFGVSFYHFIQRWRDPRIKTVTWAIWLWGLFPLIILMTGVGGYDQLAVLIFGRVLVLVTVTVAIWLMLQIVSGLLEILLLYFPFAIVRKNNRSIVRQLMPMLVILHGVLWLATMLMILWIQPTLAASFQVITSITFRLSTFDITPGSILIVVLVCYFTVLCSRATRAFLIQEVLPRHGVEKGVQASVTRLVHYAILMIGLLILLRILGFGLDKITILGGALSVGIGFGLQAIVNNFVSGLILLFERPIKIGDMIEVGEEVGEVKELGLRATTVQTFDNAEIVIPNSELITGSVTNWTLAEKLARVRVPVGVAYGSDIEQVLKILLECAENNPTVLSTPKSQALFLAFGASSLDFELRVWIPNVMDRIAVLSQLNQDIESEFQLADIEIPFPQTDLHVRSVDREISEALFGNAVAEAGRTNR